MIDFYIHQIGSINNEKTYERLNKVLQSKVIASRDYIEKNCISFSYDDMSFKLDIPQGKEWMYYDEDIHKDRVSLSDPQNRFIKKAIELKDHQTFTYFDYDYIGLAVSKDVPIIPKEETKGLAPGEVQVKDKIDSEFIVALILPISKEQLVDEKLNMFVNTISELCMKNGLPLDIYIYEGELLKERVKRLSK